MPLFLSFLSLSYYIYILIHLSFFAVSLCLTHKHTYISSMHTISFLAHAHFRTSAFKDILSLWGVTI